MKLFYSTIFNFVFVWIFFVWTLVGFFVWIPLLIRTILLVSTFMILIAISYSGTVGRCDLMRNLNSAISFYSDGFTSISSILKDIQNGSRNSNSSVRREINIEWEPVLLGTLYTLFFWIFSLSFVFQDYTIFNIVSSVINSLVIGMNIIAIPAIITVVIIVLIIVVSIFS